MFDYDVNDELLIKIKENIDNHDLVFSLLKNYIKDNIENTTFFNGGSFGNIDTNELKVFGLDSIIEEIIKYENSSSELKESLLKNPEIISHIIPNELINVIKNIDFMSSEEKIDYLINNYSTLCYNDEYYETLGSLCSNIDTLEKTVDILISNNDVYNLSQILLEANITENELDYLLFEKGLNEIVSLKKMLESKKIGFQLKQKIIINRQNAMTFWDDKNAILEYINSSETSESERRELFKLSSVNKILADCLNSGFQFENIPLQERTQIYKSDELRSYLDENGIKTVIKDHELSELDIQDICFDKKLFSRLVGKYEDFSKSDVEFKYEILKKLYENNSFVFKTLHYGLFMDEILDMGFPFIEKMSRYNIFADNLLKIYSNQKTQKIALCFGRVVKTIIKSDNYKNIDNGEIFIRLINSFSTETILSGFINYEKFDLESLTEERLLVLAQIGLKLSSPYCNEKLYDINNGIKKKDAIDSSLTLLPKIINVDDLDNFEEKRIQLCDQIFKICINNNDLEGAKNAYLNKMFGINIQEATEIIRLYGSSIEQFSSDIKYENQFTYIQKINEILSIKKISEIGKKFQLEDYFFNFDDYIKTDNSIKEMFSSDLKKNLYIIPNSDKKLMRFFTENNGVKSIVEIPVYEPNDDFKILIHSTNAYGKLDIINDNYYDSWNSSSKTNNHGICCSLISNDFLGIPDVNDVLLGFSDFSQKSIIEMAPYDIYSFNGSYVLGSGKETKFMTAKDLIDNTRHVHNELVLERYDLDFLKENNKSKKVQPNYIIICSDMSNELITKAIKCSADMKLPIVYLDKERIIEKEVEKIDKKIIDFNKSSDIDSKLKLFKEILLLHENNKSGLNFENEKYKEKFPSGKVISVIKDIYIELKTNLERTSDYEQYYHYGSKLIEILEQEQAKFEFIKQNFDKNVQFDIPVNSIKTSIMQEIDLGLCRKNSKIENIIKSGTLTDEPLSQLLSKIDSESIKKIKCDDEIKEKQLLFSSIIGKKVFSDSEGSVDLLLDFIKNKDLDYNPFKQVMVEKGYSKSDVEVCQVILKASREQEFLDVLCKENNLNDEQFKLAEKIKLCLDDSTILSQAPIEHPYSKIGCEGLKLDESKEHVFIAKEINKLYKEYDKRQFLELCYEKSCQYQKESDYDVETKSKII